MGGGPGVRRVRRGGEIGKERRFRKRERRGRRKRVNGRAEIERITG